MMNRCFRNFWVTVLLFCSFSTFAQVTNDWQRDQRRTRENTTELVDYLLVLGAKLGYNLKENFNPDQINGALIDAGKVLQWQNYLLYTSLGAIPVTAINTALAQFLPNNAPEANLINKYANTTFSKYNSPYQQTGIKVIEKVDQQNYQNDPVSQSILNILATPNSSTIGCQHGDKGANLLCQDDVLSTVIGNIPEDDQYYTYNTNKELIGQLNLNSLLGPMLYSQESTSGSDTGSPTPTGGDKNPGLIAKSQAQQAANFIRFVSGSVVPLTLAEQESYQKLKSAANEKINKKPTEKAVKAQTTLNSYLANLRVYAAQNSAGMSNLYSMLAKRMPQEQGLDSQAGTTTSQALSEYNMATWRLKLADPNKQNDKAWVERINTASAATVQKEIAILLAEINYQLYLSRQQDERLLLTQSLLLLQNIKMAQPSLQAGGAPTPQ